MLRSLTLAIMIVAIGGPLAGCSRLDLRGDGFHDEWSKSARNFRPPADEKNLAGIDERSRDIERNLGVR